MIMLITLHKGIYVITYIPIQSQILFSNQSIVNLSTFKKTEIQCVYEMIVVKKMFNLILKV